MDILHKLQLLNPVLVSDRAMTSKNHPACPDTIYPIQELIPKNVTQQVSRSVEYIHCLFRRTF
jgi:hypothetical protein